jgi:hypothetical protein
MIVDWERFNPAQERGVFAFLGPHVHFSLHTMIPHIVRLSVIDASVCVNRRAVDFEKPNNIFKYPKLSFPRTTVLNCYLGDCTSDHKSLDKRRE